MRRKINIFLLLKPKKKFGQHFLINQHLINKICQDYSGSCSAIIEVGPGPGALVFQGNRREASFQPPRLGRRSRYAWRVDEVDAWGQLTPGEVWSFRTARS